MKIRHLFILVVCWCGLAAATPGYYRLPDLHNDTLVYTAEGDLWLTDLTTNQSKRLTTHIAEEKNASFSPDGKWIAFSANYQESTEAYVIEVNGGLAKRISFENSYARVQGWTPDGKVLYATNSRIGPTGNWTLRQVNPHTLETNSIPLADAVEGAVDAKNEFIYFAQFGLQVSSDNSKLYRGGAKGEIWRYRLDSKTEAIHLTKNHPGSARRPMVHKSRIYFISNASGSDNIWSMTTQGKQLTQITHYKDWSIRSANLSNNRIVYQLGADIKKLELTNNKSEVVPIQLTSDYPNLREKWLNKPLKYVNSTLQASDFDKVVITARGRVAVAGTDKSRLVEIATPKNSRTRSALLSHDGKWVYALNDASGEIEIWRFSADGSNNAKQLTKDGKIFRWNLFLSPDGKWIAHDDKNGDLWLLNIKSGKNKKILSGNYGLSPFTDIRWSNNSEWLALTRDLLNDERSRIQLYSLKDKKQVVLTSDKYNSFSPAFSHDDQWLYFLSDRKFNASPRSPWGDRNFGPGFDRRTQVFAYALNAETNFPFQTPNELTQANRDSSITKDDKKSKSKKPKHKIDWQGIRNNLWQVPVESGNYDRLYANKEFLYLLDTNNQPEAKPSIRSIKIKPSPKVELFTDKVATFSLSDNGEMLFLRKQGNDNSEMYIVKASEKFPKDAKESKVLIDGWQLLLNPQLEWQQMFHDAWLMHRDSLFDKNMRGLNWQQTKEKYQPLLSRITDRYELNDLFAQMMGELNTLHSQVRGGDLPKDESAAKTATLGATFVQSKKGVIIQHIYQSDKELPEMASPLAKPGVDVKNGDIILAINGQKTPTLELLNKALRNQAGKQVLLTIRRNNRTLNSVVVPANSQQNYNQRYNDWVSLNRDKVRHSSDTIGYLHLHAMGANDIASFAREFYANYQKQGLIIDVRRNRGGNIDSWIIEKLLRRAWSFWQPTNGISYTNMQQTFRGHLVILADQYTYSDGETFTAGIKALNIAPVIGKQTAGAGVWLRGQNRLVDNGIARVAEFAQFSMEGKWLVEGTGVTPTIEVDNLPYATFTGKDAQLETAIEYLQEKLNKSPVPELKGEPLPRNGAPASN